MSAGVQLLFPLLFQFYYCCWHIGRTHTHTHNQRTVNERSCWWRLGANKLMQLCSCGYSLNSRNQQHKECAGQKKHRRFNFIIHVCASEPRKSETQFKSHRNHSSETVWNINYPDFRFESKCKLSTRLCAVCDGRCSKCIPCWPEWALPLSVVQNVRKVRIDGSDDSLWALVRCSDADLQSPGKLLNYSGQSGWEMNSLVYLWCTGPTHVGSSILDKCLALLNKSNRWKSEHQPRRIGNDHFLSLRIVCLASEGRACVCERECIINIFSVRTCATKTNFRPQKPSQMVVCVCVYLPET